MVVIIIVSVSYSTKNIILSYWIMLESSMTSFSFSYRQEIYDEKKEPQRRFLKWKNEDKIWPYENCKVDVIGMQDSMARIIVRRTHSKHSEFMDSDFEVNLMMGFVITGVKRILHSLKFTVKQNQDKHYGTIEDKHRELHDVRIDGAKEDIDRLEKQIKECMGNPPTNTSIFSCDSSPESKFMPVIYQPRIDAWNNFLREINVHTDSERHEVTLVFEGEELRKHAIFDFLYRAFRWAWYGRTKDIETFYVDANSEYFTFPGIYSGDATVFDDSIHEDKDEPVEKRKINYHYQDKNHPIVFVNTSNHAMSPHDNNHDFWKWEYIPWQKNIPVKTGDKTKEQTKEYYETWQ